MTVKTDTFTRKPFEVQAIQITADNMKDVAGWCNGKIKTRKKDGEVLSFIVVPVHNPVNDRQRQGYLGDWVLHSKSTGYKVYPNRSFESSFLKKEETIVYTEADAKAQLGESTHVEKLQSEGKLVDFEPLVEISS